MNTSGPLPDTSDTLLLRAALLPAREAAEAWRVWRAEHPPEQVDPLRRELFPLLLHNLSGAQIPLDDRKTLVRLVLADRARSSMVLAGWREIVRAIADRGIDTLVFKGVSLAQHYYPRPDLRLMNDMDVLVPEGKVVDAIAVLETKGVKTVGSRFARRPEMRHSGAFRGPDLPEVDLHRRLMWACQYKGADDSFWQRSLPMDAALPTTRRLSPEHEWLLACDHGLRVWATPGLRWLADGAMILRAAGGDFDVEYLAAEASRRRLVRPSVLGARYLAEQLDLPEARPLLKKLETLEWSAVEHLEARLYRGQGRPIPFSARLLCAYMRSRLGRGSWPTPWGYCAFFARHHDFPSPDFWRSRSSDSITA